MTPLLIKRTLKKYPDTASAETRQKIGSLAGGFGIVCNLVLFAAKVVAGILSGSISAISDAVNNLSDAGSSIVTLIGFKLSNRPADPEHPFGHGRIEYICGFLVSVIIMLMGFELFRSSVEKIFNPGQMELNWVTVAILLASIAVKLYMGFFNKTAGRIISSASLKATAADCVSDCASTGAVLISMGISYVAEVNIDAYAGILVSLFILWQGVNTAKETLSPLLGEPPEKEVVEELERRVLSYQGFLGVHDVMFHSYGPGRTFASLHIEVPADVDILACHEMIDLCEKEVGEAMGLQLVIHMDPIEVNDQKVTSARTNLLKAIAEQFPHNFSVHDFRMVSGEDRTNLIFDIVVSSSVKMTDAEIKEAIGAIAKTVDETYVCVITVDRDFTGTHI